MVQTVIMFSIGALGLASAGVFWLLPRLTRGDLFFAVTVAPGFRDTPQGRAILKRYRGELLIFSALALAVAAGGDAWLGPGFVPAGYLAQLSAGFWAFHRARRRVLPLAKAPTTIREADLRRPRPIVPGGILAACGPFVLLLACAGYQWSAGRDARAAVYFLGTGSLLAGFSLMLYGLAHWVRPIHAAGPEGAREQKFRRTVAGVALGVQYYLAAQASWIALAGGGPAAKGGRAMILLPLGLVLAVAAAAVLAGQGQGGGRESSAGARPVGDRTPDECWRLGIFYFNPQDPAVLMQKRFGLGYTFNFARPATWIIIGLLLMGALIPILAASLCLAEENYWLFRLYW